MLAFAHQNWTECLRNIAVVGYYDPAINLGAKRLQLQCQIEKRDMDSAHTSIHAFNMYLRRMEPQFAQLQFINENTYKPSGLSSAQSKNPIRNQHLQNLMKYCKPTPSCLRWNGSLV
jgi:hypothetical protein